MSNTGGNKVPLHPEPKSFKIPKGPKPISHKNKNTVGLGRSIANQKRLENKIEFLPDGEMRFTTDKKDPSWVKLRSVTQENSLDDFLNTAELADTDFTAEKRSQVKIIKIGNQNMAGDNSGLLSKNELLDLERKHKSFQNKLIIPRRPKWSKEQSKIELQRQENLAFLDWRRQLALLSENNDLLLTPFERNIEVWRQLWRVVERSDLIVQIVDARSPLLFRSMDLENYVEELSSPEEGREKKNLLLVNKADLLTAKQRLKWAEYFEAQGISYVFFSAAQANLLLEKEKEEEQDLNDMLDANHDDNTLDIPTGTSSEEINNKIRILKIEELEELFKTSAPEIHSTEDSPDRKLQIGLVGYPNVGKSSTINALIGSKKVSVSSTPGKTKHFQTLHLSPEIILCDCPGLVFPNFAFSKAELVCSGVLPIDQLRDHIPPMSIICERIPKYYLEAIYGIHIPIKKVEDGGNGVYATARELLSSYANARGYKTQGFGSADEPRSSRYILKDYVNGKLLHVQPPPKKEGDEWLEPTVEDSREFNKDIYQLSSLPESRRRQIIEAAASKDLDIETFDLSNDLAKLNFSQHLTSNHDEKAASSLQPERAQTVFLGDKRSTLESAGDDLDREFFKMNNSRAVMKKPITPLSELKTSKKHGKKNKKAGKK
ncbi:Piso0_004562 [Millerozyma farinosa CBS 7064]|uniref:Piso0_004562 protein n=1 Tax=Pichia sorbitophila (strain ATCC MYA-4447 / BCRC 22081 / CBS 7064 / NBRC 10061 / NRRL Y-12695) TaxID=559304 RepID=G8Y951_PICSO|nr:Piso0_004562 [Millerozyma farinosa CBS 7064]CCE84996.1 Piso0_004562 [Millerozyma farinosa CBS 7064]